MGKQSLKQWKKKVNRTGDVLADIVNACMTVRSR